MHRQHRSGRQENSSLESVLWQREGRPYCSQCQQFVKHKDAVWVGRRQCHCPACGTLLDRRLENGQAPPTSCSESEPASEQDRSA
jgi:hypothetical protein